MLTDSTTGESLRLRPRRLIVAGYTARDEASVRAHIAELAAIGVPEPATVPAFYDLDPGLLSTGASVAVAGPSTSGEVEPVIVRHGGRYYLAVGSDHTDRELERADITSAKAACPKPLGPAVVGIGERLAELDWDGLVAEATVDGRAYQRGSVGVLRHPEDTLERMVAALGPELGEPDADLVLFCGTLPLLTGEFDYGAQWRLRLTLPGEPGGVLTHEYTATRRAEQR